LKSVVGCTGRRLCAGSPVATSWLVGIVLRGDPLQVPEAFKEPEPVELAAGTRGLCNSVNVRAFGRCLHGGGEEC
jgi:hypothetical protein